MAKAKKMTLAQFMHQLKVQDKYHLWQVGSCDGHIRTENNRCPIVAVCHAKTGRLFGNYAIGKACVTLGLEPSAGKDIVSAADNVYQATPRVAKIRKQLLKAIGL